MGQGHTKCCQVPSKSHDLCTCKIWNCYVQQFWRRCIYKKVHYLTFDLDLGVKATQMLLSILYIMWPIHLQGLVLVHLTVKEEMHLQEITFFEFFDHSHKMLPSTLYIMWPIQVQSLKLLCLTVKEMHLQEITSYDLWPWIRGQGHTKCCPVPSTSCDLSRYKVWSCYIEWLRRRCIYKKLYYLTFDLEIGVKVTQNVAQYPLHHVT